MARYCILSNFVKNNMHLNHTIKSLHHFREQFLCNTVKRFKQRKSMQETVYHKNILLSASILRRDQFWFSQAGARYCHLCSILSTQDSYYKWLVSLLKNVIPSSIPILKTSIHQISCNILLVANHGIIQSWDEISTI